MSDEVWYPHGNRCCHTDTNHSGLDFCSGLFSRKMACVTERRNIAELPHRHTTCRGAEWSPRTARVLRHLMLHWNARCQRIAAFFLLENDHPGTVWWYYVVSKILRHSLILRAHKVLQGSSALRCSQDVSDQQDVRSQSLWSRRGIDESWELHCFVETKFTSGLRGIVVLDWCNDRCRNLEQSRRWIDEVGKWWDFLRHLAECPSAAPTSPPIVRTNTPLLLDKTVFVVFIISSVMEQLQWGACVCTGTVNKTKNRIICR